MARRLGAGEETRCSRVAQLGHRCPHHTSIVPTAASSVRGSDLSLLIAALPRHSPRGSASLSRVPPLVSKCSTKGSFKQKQGLQDTQAVPSGEVLLRAASQTHFPPLRIRPLLETQQRWDRLVRRCPSLLRGVGALLAFPQQVC